MSQNYNDIPVTEKVYDSLEKLLERDKTGITLGSGTSFPQEIEDWMVGRVCLRTDLRSLYYLESTDPITWSLILDFSKELATKEYVDNTYQPLNSNLTALSQLTMSADKIPYFNSSTSMSTLDLNSFTRNLLNAANASNVRTLLGLGSLALVDKINSSNISTYINDGVITAAKLNFTPITAGEGYSVGDIKESYNSAAESGYLELNKGYTIGDSSSGATYKGTAYNTLYLKLWSLSCTVTYSSSGAQVAKGNTSTQDWSAHKRLSLPNGLNYINPNCYYRIKY